MSGTTKARAVLDSQEFKGLVATRWRVSTALSLCLFALYYGYILLIGMNPGVLARRIGSGATTIGIVAGAAVILGSWVLTAAYVVWANRRYDGEVRRLRDLVL